MSRDAWRRCREARAKPPSTSQLDGKLCQRGHQQKWCVVGRASPRKRARRTYLQAVLLAHCLRSAQEDWQGGGEGGVSGALAAQRAGTKHASAAGSTWRGGATILLPNFEHVQPTCGRISPNTRMAVTAQHRGGEDKQRGLGSSRAGSGLAVAAGVGLPARKRAVQHTLQRTSQQATANCHCTLADALTPACLI